MEWASKIDQAIAKAREIGKVTKEDDFRDKPTFLGYRAVHLDVEMPNGMTTEIQINTPEGAAQKNYVHDPVYGKWRQYIEAPGESTYEDVLGRIPLKDQTDFIKDTLHSKGVFNGTIPVPTNVIRETTAKFIKP